jgi:hypothetical protein
MAKIKIKAVPKMQGGGYTFPFGAPVTAGERESWNRYQAALSKVPGQGVINWGGSEDLQKRIAQETGFPYERAAAIQADMMSRASTMPGSVSGITGKDPWGGLPGWVGGREKQKSYPVYQYEQQKKNPATGGYETYYTEKTGTEAIPSAGLASFTERAHKAVPTQQPIQETGSSKLPTNFTGSYQGKSYIGGVEDVPVAKYGGMKKKIRIKSMPTNTPVDNIRMGAGEGETPMMWAGGYASKGPSHGYGNQQVGQGYALDRFWSSPTGYPGGTAKVSPYHSTGKTLPEAKEGGDINAEKQEQVLGDFDQDGSMELMNVNGKPHTQGGKDINVPSNSFVYSDTKALKIKDATVLAMFGMQPKRGGYTPAEIAKKYDLNKFKKVLSDPNADVSAKTTAQLMTDNYLAKLDKLAKVQEGMKKHMGMDHHDPNAPKETKYGGVPMMQSDGRPDKVYTHQFDESGKMTLVPEEDNDIANTQIAQTVSPVYKMQVSNNYGSDYAPWDPRVGQAQGYPATAPQTTADYQRWANMRGAGLKVDDKLGVQTLGWENPDKSISRLPVTNSMIFGNQDSIQPLELAGLKLLPTDIQQQQMSGVDMPGLPKEKVSGKGNKWKMAIDPNLYGDFMTGLQMAQLRKFHPYEPVPQAVIPETVFADPTRAIAAQQEMARTAMEMAGQGDQRAARATTLGLQGEAGKQAADVIAQYNTQNVAIANAANAQAAQLTNELMAKQANRLAELNKAGFLADRDYQREMGRLQAEYADRKQKQHDTAVKTAWLNKTSPYFDIDPITQMPVFKSDRAKDAYFKDLQGGPSTGMGTDYASLVKKFTGPGYNLPQDKAEELAIGQIEQELRIPRTRTTGTDPATGRKVVTSAPVNQSKYGGSMMRYGGSHMALPSMAPAYQQNAERIPYYQIGGEFVGLPSMPTLFPSVDNTRYQQPVAPQYSQEEMSFPKGKPLAGVPTKRMSKTDIATATNNPGNIIYKPIFGELFGATSSGIKQKDGNGMFASFPDLETGVKAYQTQLFGDTDGVMKSDYYKKDTTVDQALKKWSNGGYDGNIYPEIKDKKLGELSQAERKELAKRQIKHESGDMYKILQQRGVFKYGGSALQKFMKK